jgi:pyrroline-5-carboxylate reductase
MSAEDLIRTKKIGVIGAGNLGFAVLKAIADSGMVPLANLYASSRNEKKLSRLCEELKINVLSNNETLIEACDVVFIGVKPQDLYSAIEPISSSFHQDHMVISLAAGVSLSSLKKLIPEAGAIARVIPNTAARLRKSVVAIAPNPNAAAQMTWLEKLLSSLGYVVKVDDGEMLEALMVASSSGIGFVFELMIYWQEWLEERGISPEEARKITTQVFVGASALAESAPNTSFEELQRKVTSTKGVTAAGLDSMRELEIERTLRISFEKAALRDQELGKHWEGPR